MTSDISTGRAPVTAHATATARAPLQIPQRMRHAINCTVVGLLLLNVWVLATLSSWQQVASPQLETSSRGQPTTKIVTDRSHLFDLVVPSSWIVEDHESFAMLVGNLSEDAVVSVFAESKSQLKQLDEKYQRLENYSELVRGKLIEHLKDGTQTVPTHLVINGCPAIQSQIEGEDESKKLTFLHTVVDAPTDFYTIRAVTSSSRYPVVKPQLEAIVATFRMRAVTSASNP